jgi:hypothetical protein
VHGQSAQLLVRACASSQRRQPEFVVAWDNSKEFVGSTPTAPFAKLALYIGSMEVANGVKVWRLIGMLPDPHVPGICMCLASSCAAFEDSA